MTEEMIKEILENEGQEGVNNALDYSEEWFEVNAENVEL